MSNLWMENTPEKFWRLDPPVPEAVWANALRIALPVLNIAELKEDSSAEEIVACVLGEGQFGQSHWQLGLAKRMYYFLKPLLPRPLTRLMRKMYSGKTRGDFPLDWPIEDRYVRFLWEVMRQVILSNAGAPLRFIHFWPDDYRSALVLTHDIETEKGQSFVRRVAELEADLGFRSSFNFIPERYPLDRELMDWLRKNGFEIGVHGLKHDGKLFLNRAEFSRRAQKINAYLREFGAVGFRAPLTHRQPEWMQDLDAAYDASFFDSDPFEPIAGGVMTVWPFEIGRFMELPYTLVQDFSLLNLLEEKTARIWLEKAAYLRRVHGMALINTHPDYLQQNDHLSIYRDFLSVQAGSADVWRALPRETAAWWKARRQTIRWQDLRRAKTASAILGSDAQQITITIP